MDSALGGRGGRGGRGLREGQPRPYFTDEERMLCKAGELPEAHGGLELGSDLNPDFLRRRAVPTARAQTAAPAK